MKRLALIAASALAVATGLVVAPAGTSGAQQADANINVFNAAASSYPNVDSQRYVCTSGGSTFSGAIGLGESLEVEMAPGDLVIDVYDGEGVESCAGTPDRSITVTVGAGEITGVVIGFDTLFTFPIDYSCMAGQTGRIQFADGSGPHEAWDLYAVSQTDFDHVLLAASMEPGQSVLVPDVPADDYVFEAYTPGIDPDVNPPLALLGGATVKPNFQVQAFLAGTDDGNSTRGTFHLDEGPIPCDEELPPTTATTSSSTTTTTVAVSPGTATPAVPVSGTATFTG